MNLEHKSKKEMLSILNKTFGSKRTKRRTEIREHMAINVEEVKEQLEKTIQSMNILLQISSTLSEARNVQLDTILAL